MASFEDLLLKNSLRQKRRRDIFADKIVDTHSDRTVALDEETKQRNDMLDSTWRTENEFDEAEAGGLEQLNLLVEEHR